MDEKHSSLYDAVLQRVEKDLGSVFHDVNNPLSIISGNIQLLEQLLVMGDPDPDVMAVVDDIRIACDKMTDAAKLIDQLRADVRSISTPEADAEGSGDSA